MRSIFPRSFSEKALSNEGGGTASGSMHLYLNVYDLTPANNYLYWFGIGVFHSGIEDSLSVAFTIYALRQIPICAFSSWNGAHDYATSGVFEVEPKSCPGFMFRCSVWLGTTTLSRAEVCILIEDLAGRYHGDAYHLIIKNCNHFTDEVWLRLTGKPIPGWDRIAVVFSQKTLLLSDLLSYPEDGSESYSLSDEEDADHHLLSKPACEIVHSNDDSVWDC